MFNSGIVKKDIRSMMSEYFLEPRFSGGEVKVKLDLSSCAAKTDLKKKHQNLLKRLVWLIQNLI